MTTEIYTFPKLAVGMVDFSGLIVYILPQYLEMMQSGTFARYDFEAD